jgi:diguanylate cyclase (GGDEF)-like protein
VPMRAPVVVGWVLMGFPIHQTLANQMQQLLDVQVALRVPEANGQWSIPVSTLDAAGLAALQQQQSPRQLAYWDRLTGLPNRAQFRDAVAAAMDASTAAAVQGAPVAPLSVVMLDLDRFKHVNDVLGYAFGDRLLQAVAARLLHQAVREGDVVARFSGDEFALLLPGTTSAQALAVAERIASAFEEPIVLDDHTVDLAAGFGVACWPEHASDSGHPADVLMSRAEIAMYTAKQKTASALVYHPSIDAGSAQTLSLLSELRQAVDNHELRLFLQPKIDLASGRLLGAEALVRWQHPQRGLVPPMQFIPFAEQTGFVRQLTLWIFEETARQWPVLRALGLQRVSVNLSTRDLLDQDLLPKLQARLQRYGVPATAFCLEITESAIMDEPQRALATLKAPERGRLQAVDRRLRHRLLQPGLPEEAAGGRAEDRQELRHGHGQRRRGREDRAQHHRPGPQPGPDRGGRGRRDPGHHGPAAQPGLRRGPGLPR